MSDFIMRYWLEAIFGFLLAGLGFGYRSLARRIREQEAAKLGIQALLRDRMIESYHHYADTGYCPIYAGENLAVLYTQYKALSGNGIIANLVVHLADLPTDGSDER